MYKILNSNKANNVFTLEIQVDNKIWEDEINKAVNSAAKNISIPGFRKGKIPENKAKEYINYSVVFEKAANKVLNIIFDSVMEDDVIANDENIINANPEVDIKKISDKELEFSFNFDLMPEIEVADYKKIENIKSPKLIDDLDVQHQIKLLMKNDAEVVTKSIEVVSDQDIAIIDFKGKVDGKQLDSATANDYELEIGSKSFIDGFENALIGMKKNETKLINLKFPDDYHATDLKGKPVEFEVTIKDIKSINYPTLDDAYVKTLKQDQLSKKAETVAELKDNIKEQLTKNINSSTHNQNINTVREYLVNNSKFSYIPQKLLVSQARRIKDQYLAQIKQYKMELKDLLAMQNMTEEKLDEEIKKEAENNVKQSLLIEKISNDENIECTETDFQNKINELVEQYQITDSNAKEATKKQLSQQRELIETIVIGDKLIDHIIKLNQK